MRNFIVFGFLAVFSFNSDSVFAKGKECDDFASTNDVYDTFMAFSNEEGVMKKEHKYSVVYKVASDKSNALINAICDTGSDLRAVAHEAEQMCRSTCTEMADTLGKSSKVTGEVAQECRTICAINRKAKDAYIDGVKRGSKGQDCIRPTKDSIVDLKREAKEISAEVEGQAATKTKVNTK